MRQVKPQIFLVFCLVAVLTIFGDSKGIFNPVRTVFAFIFSPVEHGAYSIRNNVSDSISFLTFWKSGEERIKNLELRNLELVDSANRVKQLEQENGELRKQLGVSVLPDQKKLPAEVLGVSRFMTINRGLRDGVVVGQSVIYLNNLVGRVERADYSASEVQLPTDSDAKIPVKVGVAGTVQGVTSGQFNSAMILDQVTQNEEVKSDDLIFTTGDGGTYVADLVVGKVEKIISSPTDLFKRADMEALITYDKLTTVFVLIK